MPAILIAILVFLLVFGGVLLGMHVRTVLPEQHRGPEAKEVFNLGIGLIGTPTALILALVTSSAKTSFDSLASEVNQTQDSEVDAARRHLQIDVLDAQIAHRGLDGVEGRAGEAHVLRQSQIWHYGRILIN